MTRIPLRGAADNGAQSLSQSMTQDQTQDQSQANTQQAEPRPHILRFPEPYIVLEDYIGTTHHELVAKKDDILQVCGFLNSLSNTDSLTGMPQPVAHAKNMRNEMAGSIPLSHIRKLSDEERKSRDIKPWHSHIETLSYDSAAVYASVAAAHAVVAATPRGRDSSSGIGIKADDTVEVHAEPAKCSRLWGSLAWKAGDHLRFYFYQIPGHIMAEIKRLTGQNNGGHQIYHRTNRAEELRPCCDGAEKKYKDEETVWHIFGYNLRTGQFGYFNLYDVSSWCVDDKI